MLTRVNKSAKPYNKSIEVKNLFGFATAIKATNFSILKHEYIEEDIMPAKVHSSCYKIIGTNMLDYNNYQKQFALRKEINNYKEELSKALDNMIDHNFAFKQIHGYFKNGSTKMSKTYEQAIIENAENLREFIKVIESVMNKLYKDLQNGDIEFGKKEISEIFYSAYTCFMKPFSESLFKIYTFEVKKEQYGAYILSQYKSNPDIINQIKHDDVKLYKVDYKNEEQRRKDLDDSIDNIKRTLKEIYNLQKNISSIQENLKLLFKAQKELKALDDNKDIGISLI